jgi:hypothetical protein
MINQYELVSMAQQGWQCPVCKHVFSPSTPVCFYCPPKTETTTNTTHYTGQHSYDTPTHTGATSSAELNEMKNQFWNSAPYWKPDAK